MHQSPVRFGSITWICVHVRKVYVKRLADCVEITLQLMSHESLLFITKMRGRVQVMGLCVFVTVFAHRMCVMVGTWLFLGH